MAGKCQTQTFLRTGRDPTQLLPAYAKLASKAPAPLRAGAGAGAGFSPLLVCQLSEIGYLARSAPIRASAFSTAACGVTPSRMISAWAAPQICWASASA